MSMASVSRRIYAVEEINTSLYAFQNIGRGAHAHKVGWLVHREIRYHLIQNVVHFLMGLANCQTADRITVQIHLSDPLGMLDTDIFKYSSLIDSKKHLLFIDRIRKGI